MRRSLLVLLALALCPTGVLAGEKKPADKPKSLTTEQAANVVLKAMKANDHTALKALAEKEDPDPWLVADELCHRGEHDAADAFAKAAPRKTVEKLPGYVATRHGLDPDNKAPGVLKAAKTAMASEEWQKVCDIADTIGSMDIVPRVMVGYAAGLALRRLKRPADSNRLLMSVGEAAHALGWLSQAAVAFYHAGLSAYRVSAWQEASTAWESRLGVERARGNRAGVAKTLGHIGLTEVRLGQPAAARQYFEESLEIHRALGNRIEISDTLSNIGILEKRLGNYEEALGLYEESLRMLRVLGAGMRSTGVAKTLNNIGNLQARLGNYREAQRCLEDALEIHRQLGNKFEVGGTLNNLGNVLGSLGDLEGALEHHLESLGLFRSHGSREGIAAALDSLGSVQKGLGNTDEALTHLEESVRIERAIGNKYGLAASLINSGILHGSLGAHDVAHARYTEALQISRSLADSAGMASALVNMGVVEERRGNYAKAQDAYVQALRLLDQSPKRQSQARATWGLARLSLHRSDVAEAMGWARRGIGYASEIAKGLSWRQGADAREVFAGLFDVGYRIALRSREPEDLTALMEMGRAGSLLESLGSRSALETVVIPRDLRRSLALARYAERRTLGTYKRSQRRGDLNTIRMAREAWRDAQADVLRVASRIEREAKHAASITVAHPDGQKAIQDRLVPTDALVYYALTSEHGVALVVRKNTARVVALPASKDIEAAMEALLDGEQHIDPAEVPALRKMLVEPLKLDKAVKRILVSPMNRLAYVPFSMLFPDHEVANVPSGTTYGLLLEEKGKRGEKIFALGDPDYQTQVNDLALKIRGGNVTRLQRLPATKKEVEAVGDVRLLDKQATETGLEETVKQRKRWRAVHFACHGLVDPERPMLSALALTADKENDGFLTALEIFRMKIPADLVVLSACETGKGKIYKTEGIVGLTHAFMFAGAPRVICSLWKVDDEATQALMVKFYELWNPKNGRKGLSCAAALKRAQEYVRDFKGKTGNEKWKHPYFWAAWVLWGLPD